MAAKFWQASEHKKALVVLTSHDRLGSTGQPTGFWLSELVHPYFMLHDSGITVDIVSIKGGKAVMDPRGRDQKDPDNRRFLADEELIKAVDNTPALQDVDIGLYQGILFVGGHGAMWDFPDNPGVKRAVTQLYEAGHVVAAVCHGAAALVNATLSDGSYLVKGKQLTAFTNKEEVQTELQDTVPFLLQDKLSERGARFDERPPWQEYVVADQNLLTGQNPQSAKPLGIAMVKQLKASTPAVGA